MFHNYVELAVFLPGTKCFNTLAICCSKAYSICDKLSQNDGWRTRCAQVASYFIDHGICHTLGIENEELAIIT